MTSTSIQMSKQLLLGELIRRTAHKTPDRVAFIYDNNRITYHELEERTIHLAGWIQRNGIDIGDKVGVISKNSLSLIEVIFGIAHSGGVSVPINFRLVPEELVYIINNSDSKILFIEEEYEDTILSIKNRLPNVKEVIVMVIRNQPILSNMMRFFKRM
ncbi:AMP-binding protein [Alkalihalobacterium alkalinitrilicum]|uniref:AMP-binding protein n=1 Tax=Alkalihalobacterium alkalinitrilicum TaxID=427920 RepID=UPI002368588C|nr:AMP-binding protein [Alkalihalobacterium alkalinitrilicum]